MLVEVGWRGIRERATTHCSQPYLACLRATRSLGQDVSFDLMISGINRGDNAGLHVIYSGTVGAAREAACKVRGGGADRRTRMASQAVGGGYGRVTGEWGRALPGPSDAWCHSVRPALLGDATICHTEPMPRQRLAKHAVNPQFRSTYFPHTRGVSNSVEPVPLCSPNMHAQPSPLCLPTTHTHTHTCTRTHTHTHFFLVLFNTHIFCSLIRTYTPTHARRASPPWHFHWTTTWRARRTTTRCPPAWRWRSPRRPWGCCRGRRRAAVRRRPRSRAWSSTSTSPSRRARCFRGCSWRARCGRLWQEVAGAGGGSGRRWQ